MNKQEQQAGTGPVERPVRRLLDWLRGWRSSGTRVEGEWYWVTDGKNVWTAISYARAVGGWSNHDTWEDFDRAVTAWKRIRTPRAPNARLSGRQQP